MKILKNIINVILSFILVFCIIINIGLNLLDNTILDRNYIVNKMDEIEFSVLVSREVQSGFENYIYQSGLPEDTIENLFTDETLENDINSILDCVYDGTEIVLSDEIVRENLDLKIQDYLTSERKTLNDQGKENINKFEDLIVNEYKKNVNVSNTLYETGHSMLQKVINIREKIGYIPVIVIVILVILLIIINIKNLMNVINYLGISFLSAGVLLKIGVGLIFSKIDFDNLILLATSITNLVVSVIKENLYKLSDTGNTYIFIGIFGIIVYALLKDGKIVEKTKKIIKPKRRNIKREDA